MTIGFVNKLENYISILFTLESNTKSITLVGMAFSRRTHMLIVFVAALALLLNAHPALGQATDDELEALEEGLEQPESPEQDEEEEDEDIEEDFDEEEPPAGILPRLPFTRRPPAPLAKPDVFVGDAGEEAAGDARNIIIDGLVSLNYVFNDAPESFIINYHFRIEGETRARTAVIRGEAAIDVKVEGVLAKWPGGECTLGITIPKAPFQVTFRRKEDSDDANINLRFTKPIMEEWESTCTFGESGAKPFVTKGMPEKWLQRALAKTSPPMRSLVAKLDDNEKTTNNFLVNKHQINDPPLGTIEVEGKGIITIIPAGLEEME